MDSPTSKSQNGSGHTQSDTQTPTDYEQGRRQDTGGDRSRDGAKSRGSGRHDGRGGQDQKGRGRKIKERGRAEWSRTQVDKRARNLKFQESVKRRKLEGKDESLPVYATRFSKEEIEAQEKKPKRKVAVMIGYSGSGYKGMQVNHHEKTIEGDLFTAFVAAGAISKANADDPRKSSLVRCARTDKGVHAAGNVISLKLIVEDPDVVAKINNHLSPQIRVWGIERTNGSFNAYQFCDSRIYEYLIPTHCFLPPHPESFLAKNLADLNEKVDDLDGYHDRQKEVADFWTETEETYVRPVIEDTDPAIRDAALSSFYEHDQTVSRPSDPDTVAGAQEDHRDTLDHSRDDGDHVPEVTSLNADENTTAVEQAGPATPVGSSEPLPKEPSPLENAVRRLKAAHIAAKLAYRIDPDRLARIRSCLSRFEGTHRYHNFTIDKTHKDPSANRTIKTFKVDDHPIVTNDTEWLSLKVHGQSFMMHQIRKMVSMIALMVRCGCPEERLQDSFGKEKISIPKAPSLGLLLERPVFDEYNHKLEEFGWAKIDFERYRKEIEAFKQREIYERIFREEEKSNSFHAFFTGLDHTKSSQLLYLSSLGVPATERIVPPLSEGRMYMLEENIGQVEEDDEGIGGKGG